MSLDRWEMFGQRGETLETWVWCLHCERAYQLKDIRHEDDLELCAYEDCDGDAVLDAWNWTKFRQRNPEATETPERDVVYPLYPEEDEGG